MKRVFKKLFAAILAVVLVTGIIPEIGYINVYAADPVYVDLLAEAAPDKSYDGPRIDSAIKIVPAEGMPEHPILNQPYTFKIVGVPKGYEINNQASYVAYNNNNKTFPLGEPVDGYYTLSGNVLDQTLVTIELIFKKAEDPSEPARVEQSEADPIQNAATGGTWNLFYTTYYGQPAMKINLPAGAVPSDGGGNWTKYYKVSDTGEVTVIPQDAKNRKDAAKGVNSLITIPIKSGGVKTGVFQYQLPVCYSKPQLNLSSKGGKVYTNVNEVQTLMTRVNMKRASGLYEPLDLSTQRADVSLYSSKFGATAAIYTGADSRTGDVIIQASQGDKVELHIQLADWCTSIPCRYTVGVSKRNVFTYSVDGKQYEEKDIVKVILNKNAPFPGKDHVIKLRINGKPAQLKDEDIIRNKTDGKGKFTIGADGDTITIKYPNDPKEMLSGTYSYKIKTDNGTFIIKVVVSNKVLSKAIEINKTGAIDLVTGQKITLTTKFTEITGPVEEVRVDDPNFSVSYDDLTGYIYLGKAEGGSLSIKSYSPTIYITVGGIDCPIKVSSFSVKATKPTIKLGNAVLPQSKIKDGTAEAAVNLNAYVQNKGIAYNVNPSAVEFVDGKADGDDGWYLISKSNVRAKYDSEKRCILVKALAQPDKIKLSSIKIKVYFNGLNKVITKNISVKKSTK